MYGRNNIKQLYNYNCNKVNYKGDGVHLLI